ncbi:MULTISPECIES: sigma-70 family RNA polymerase sigma factor [unclassified Nocardioides]|uniref:sigma-70 family RNA polymerase sigma factor n=1 Tax=unclassified Nocardioides TaxID=2615069 RepID=UPI003014F348
MTTHASGTAVRLSDRERSERTRELFACVAEAAPDRRQHLLNEIVEINLRVAHAIARRFEGRGIALDDLEQVAAMSLVRAASKFSLSHERDFLSYAVPTISGELKRYFRDHGWMIRPPRRIQEAQSNVLRLHHTGHQDGTPMTPAEIAADLDIPVETVHEALRAEGLFQPASLDRPVHGETDEPGMTLGDMLAEDEDDHDVSEARLLLRPVLRQLSERDRRILALRFLEDQTQSEIGDEIGLSQMQVSRHLSRILRDARREIGEDAWHR